MGKKRRKVSGNQFLRRAMLNWLRERGVGFGNIPKYRVIVDMILQHPDCPPELREGMKRLRQNRGDSAEACKALGANPGTKLIRRPGETKAERKAHAAAQTDKRKAFYWTDEWRRLRYLALKKHGGKCQCCGASPKNGIRLHVDHIKPRSQYPHLELDLSNLQVLCEDCNLGKSNRDQTDWRPNVVNFPSGDAA